VRLALEFLHVLVELLDDRLDVLKLVLAEGAELLDGAKQILKLADTAAEQVEAAKDLLRREVELLTLGHVHQTLLGEVVLMLVGFVQLNAGVQDGDEVIWRVVLVLPELIIRDVALLWDLALAGELEVHDRLLTSLDHAGGDLGQETGHLLICVVVASDSVDHLDRVHQCRKDILD
jgi:hypothetical protein